MKQIIIEVPDWVDYDEIKSLVRKYIEEKADKGLTLEEFKKIYEIEEEEIVEGRTGIFKANKGEGKEKSK